jgi:antitoxin VapB
MLTAKLFTDGKSQAVRLPKEYHFAENEVGVTRIGDMIVLYPKEKAFKIFTACEPVT